MIQKHKMIGNSFLVAMLLVLLAGCHRAPDETQVRDAIASMARAAETGSASDLGKPLTDDFEGNAGELDRKTLVDMMRLMALRRDHVGVTSGPVTIEHHGDRMVAKLTVSLTSGGTILPDNLGIYQVESGWRNDGGQWRCYTARWTQPGR